MGSDFNVSGANNGRVLVIFSGTSFQTLSIQHVIDGVAQENNETYNLTLSNSFNLDLFSFEGITVTIIDADRKLTLCQLVCPIIKTYTVEPLYKGHAWGQVF